MPSSFSSSTAPSLSAFTQLSSSVYLYEPFDNATASNSISGTHEAILGTASTATSDSQTYVRANVSSPSSPKLIILVTWMSAHPLHISKYILGYRTHHPTSRILLVRSSPPDLFYRRTRTQRSRVAPAVSTILSSCTAATANPAILLHLFSNGGSHQTRNLLLAYSETTSCPFPPHVTIFDSCPGRASFKRSVLALSSALPSSPPLRLLLSLLIYAVVTVYWVIFIPLGIPDPIERIRQALNDAAMMQGETSRCYIYSKADTMVDWNDVEGHACDAASRGFVVHSERFEQSGHCAHIRVEGGTRYWAIVNDMWQVGRQEQGK